jgi:hypothetical protein
VLSQNAGSATGKDDDQSVHVGDDGSALLRAAATDDLRESLDHLRMELRLTPRPDATPTTPNTSNQAK